MAEQDPSTTSPSTASSPATRTRKPESARVTVHFGISGHRLAQSPPLDNAQPAEATNPVREEERSGESGKSLSTSGSSSPVSSPSETYSSRLEDALRRIEETKAMMCQLDNVLGNPPPTTSPVGFPQAEQPHSTPSVEDSSSDSESEREQPEQTESASKNEEREAPKLQNILWNWEFPAVPPPESVGGIGNLAEQVSTNDTVRLLYQIVVTTVLPTLADIQREQAQLRELLASIDRRTTQISLTLSERNTDPKPQEPGEPKPQYLIGIARKSAPMPNKRELRNKALKLLGTDPSREKIMAILGIDEATLDEILSSTSHSSGRTNPRRGSKPPMPNKREALKAFEVLGVDPSVEKLMQVLGLDEETVREAANIPPIKRGSLPEFTHAPFPDDEKERSEEERETTTSEDEDEDEHTRQRLIQLVAEKMKKDEAEKIAKGQIEANQSAHGTLAPVGSPETGENLGGTVSGAVDETGDAAGGLGNPTSLLSAHNINKKHNNKPQTEVHSPMARTRRAYSVSEIHPKSSSLGRMSRERKKLKGLLDKRKSGKALARLGLDPSKEKVKDLLGIDNETATRAMTPPLSPENSRRTSIDPEKTHFVSKQ